MGLAKHQRRKPTTGTVVPEPHDAPGVDYVQSDLAPNLKLFHCAPFRAHLTQHGCASRWRQAQNATGHLGEALAPCRACPIGAHHAGRPFVWHSAHYAKPICPRCRNFNLRIIKGQVCVNCYNRAREVASGRNARGNLPTKLIANAPREFSLRISVNGIPRRVHAEGIDLLEPVIQTLRTTRGDLSFSFSAPMGAGPRQGRLF
jgi:hypothetical protein